MPWMPFLDGEQILLFLLLLLFVEEELSFMVEDLIRFVVIACSATQQSRTAGLKQMSQLVLRHSSLLAVS